MTLIALESFDHHGSTNTNLDDTLTRKHFSRTGTWELITGRGGGNAGAVNSVSDDITFEFDGVDEIIIGFAVKFRTLTSNSTTALIRFIDPTNIRTQCSFFRFGGGQPGLSVSEGNFASPIKWNSLMWNYFEIRLLVSETVGEIEMTQNGEIVISETGIDTQFADPDVGFINFTGVAEYDPIFDDIYIATTSGSVNNTFLGDTVVEAVFPNAIGNTTDLALTGAATNHEAVADNPFDDDTSYVSTSTIDDKDTYNVSDLSFITQDIKGVQILSNGNKANAIGTRGITPVVRSGGADYDQTEFNLTTSYDYHPEIVETDPDTGSAWTVGGFNSAEFGYRVSV